MDALWGWWEASMPENTEFADFIRRIRAGDDEAARELVTRYEPIIRREVRVRLRDPRLYSRFDWTDVCQSVMASFFVRAAAGQFDLEQPDQLLRLLVVMARHKLAKEERRHRAGRRDYRRLEPADPAHLEERAAAAPSPSRLVAGRELLDEFRRRLSDEERQLADLRAAGYEWAEIASRLGGTPVVQQATGAGTGPGRAADRGERAMRRTRNGWLQIPAIALGLALSAATALAAGSAKPNVIIILADDLGYGDLGFQGCLDIPTPRIDSLARNGVRCTNGYVTGANCSPTRAGLLTGRYQQRFGHEFNPAETRNERFGLPIFETTIADRLKAAGYVTGIVGKWHLGFDRRYHPLERGFDEFFGFLGGSHPYFPGRGPAIYRGTRAVGEQEYLTDAFGREAVSFITRHKDQPFFLYLAFNAVHLPKQATDDRLARFASITDPARRNYAAMLAALDLAVGKVLDTVRSERLEEKTLIFFLSDNGGPTRMGGINGSRNEPLRGSKRTTLEGGVRVPFVVQWKGKIPVGTVYEEPVIQLDILPTALAAAEVGIRPEWHLDGVDSGRPASAATVARVLPLDSTRCRRASRPQTGSIGYRLSSYFSTRSESTSR